MGHFSDVEGTRSTGAGNLGVAFQAQIGVVLSEHFRIHGTVRRMANDAPFAQRLVFVDKRAGLLAMTFSAGFIQARHGQTAFGFEDVAAVRIVALHAVHFIFDDRMVMGKLELGVLFEVTLKTGGRFTPGIDDKFAAATARFDVPARGTMAGLATGSTGKFFLIEMDTGMDAGGKGARNGRVTVGTRFISDEMGAGNFERRHDGACGRGGTGTNQKPRTDETGQESQAKPGMPSFHRDPPRAGNGKGNTVRGHGKTTSVVSAGEFTGGASGFGLKNSRRI